MTPAASGTTPFPTGAATAPAPVAAFMVEMLDEVVDVASVTAAAFDLEPGVVWDILLDHLTELILPTALDAAPVSDHRTADYHQLERRRHSTEMLATLTANTNTPDVVLHRLVTLAADGDLTNLSYLPTLTNPNASDATRDLIFERFGIRAPHVTGPDSSGLRTADWPET